MPEVSRFYGIIIRIFYDDHNPPHFHADYGEHEVLLNINTLAILAGNLPARGARDGDLVSISPSARTSRGVGASKPASSARQDRAVAVPPHGVA